MTQYNDANPEETKEWLEALRSVIREEGAERAHFLLSRLPDEASAKPCEERRKACNDGNDSDWEV